MAAAQPPTPRSPAAGARGSEQSPLRVIRGETQLENPAAATPVPRKIARYAARLLERYDHNQSGVLDRDEWSQMMGTHRLADTNEDGLITVDELIARIKAYSRGRSLRLLPALVPRFVDASAPAGGAADSSRLAMTDAADATSEEDPPRRVPRFYVAPNRLPAGLPEWFITQDVDGDGQLTMQEFSPQQTPAETTRFREVDANYDGLLTPAEWLAAEKNAANSAADKAAKASADAEPMTNAAPAAEPVPPQP